MDEKDILSRLWEEVRLRQDHYWSSFNRFALAIITINVVPYVKPELGGQLGGLVVAFPATSVLISLVCTWLLGAEYQRLRMVRNAYDERFSKICEIPRMPLDTPWHRLVARRIGSATSVLFGIGFTALSLANVVALLLFPVCVAASDGTP